MKTIISLLILTGTVAATTAYADSVWHNEYVTSWGLTQDIAREQACSSAQVRCQNTFGTACSYYLSQDYGLRVDGYYYSYCEYTAGLY